jgi:HAD superfamily hydrolase (TIGR01509 family)
VKRPAIFLDDGGVMNDNARRALQWQRLVGVFFAPRLGGTEDAWARANAIVFEREMVRYEAAHRVNPLLGPQEDREEYHDRWLCEMAEEAGLAVPSDRRERLNLVDESTIFITRNVHADYPGAVDAIRALHRAGYVLRTASGTPSLDLEGYLVAMGVRDCFGTLYGPDLVETSKTSPRYFERIFAHADVDPADALVVDDNEMVLDWASAVGARTVLCHPQPPRSAQHGHVEALARLPTAISAD